MRGLAILGLVSVFFATLVSNVGARGLGADKRAKKVKKPQPSLGPASANSDLSRAEIRTVIRGKLKGIRHCYERQLMVDPKLSGTLTVHFVIEPDGTVSKAKASGPLDAKVDGCVVKIVAGLKFPKPRGGGLVQVSYPFKFLSKSQAANVGVVGALQDSDSSFAALTPGLGTGTSIGYGRLTTPRPRVRLGAAYVVTGALDRGIVRRVVRQRLAQIRYCYHKDLLKDPKLSGKLTAKFRIIADGRVTHSKSTGLTSSVRACVNKVFARMRFPKPKHGSVSVTLPFMLSPAPKPALSKHQPSSPNVRLLRPTMVGGIDRDVLRRQLREITPQLRLCYVSSLAQQPNLSGRASVRFNISTKGTVNSVAVTGLPASLSACLKKQVRKLSFPKRKSGSVQITYPMLFALTP